MLNLPEEIMKDINIAKEILLREGAKEIYIFGSLVDGKYTNNSDIDIAIVGLKEDIYFKIYGELLEKLQNKFDLIGLDYNNDFSKIIKETGKFERVA